MVSVLVCTRATVPRGSNGDESAKESRKVMRLTVKRRGCGGACEESKVAMLLGPWRSAQDGGQDIGEGAGVEASEGGCYGDDGDVGCWCCGCDDVQRGQGVDYGLLMNVLSMCHLILSIGPSRRDGFKARTWCLQLKDPVAAGGSLAVLGDNVA